VAVCARCGADNREGAKFCDACGAPLAVAAAPEQRKTVTVLFCDVSGSTALGERVDPEALRAIMSRYFDVARTAIERHGGTVEKFIGDAVMAVFGVPTVHEDDALRAVRAALELRDAVEIEVRIGVNTGEVVTGGGEKLATGDAVNVAARLEQSASSGDVLLGPQTYALVRDVVDAELLPPIDAKGKAEPLTAYRVRSLTGDARRRNSAGMVGRARELTLLAHAFERARHEHACHLFTILGNAGIGKSRLVSEFLDGLSSARTVTGRCLSYGDGITYRPVVEVLQQLEIPVQSVLHDATSPPEIAWSVRKALEQAALDEPLVVVFDDIQWGEESFLDLIEHVADLSRDASILLLCMARPDLLEVRPGWGGGKVNATSVLLEPLAQTETTALVRALLGADDDALVARIGAAADGNPLFAEEMVELTRSSGGEVAVPATIQALLSARLDGLSAEERVVLECGAVEGQVFRRSAVAALAEGGVDAQLTALVRKELLRPEPADDGYRFRHLLIRDAAYDAVPKARRIGHHTRFAEWLVEHDPALVELDEIAGYHLEQAANYAGELGRDPLVLGKRAAIHLTQAALRADARGDAGAAVKLGLRAERLVARDDPRRLLLLPTLARALDDCGRGDEAILLLDEAIADGDAVTAARARAIRAVTRTLARGLSVDWARGEAEQAIAELTPLGDDEGLANAYVALAWISLWSGSVGRMGFAAERARVHAERKGDMSTVVEAIGLQAAALLRSDAPLSQAESFAEELLALDHGLKLHANALFLQSRCAAERLRVSEARSLRSEAIRLMEELGLEVLAAGTYQLGAAYEWLAEDWAEMEGSARTAWERFEHVGDRGLRATAGALLAYAWLELGRLEEAEQLIDEAVALNADPTTLWWAHCGRSLAAIVHGDPTAAVEHAHRALTIVEGSDDAFNRSIVLIALAEAQSAAGDLDGCSATVAEASALAERRESAAFLARAQSVLATMAS